MQSQIHNVETTMLFKVPTDVIQDIIDKCNDQMTFDTYQEAINLSFDGVVFMTSDELKSLLDLRNED